MHTDTLLELVNRHQRELESLRAWIWILEGEFTDAELAVLYTRYQRGRRAAVDRTHEGSL